MHRIITVCTVIFKGPIFCERPGLFIKLNTFSLKHGFSLRSDIRKI